MSGTVDAEILAVAVVVIARDEEIGNDAVETAAIRRVFEIPCARVPRYCTSTLPGESAPRVREP